jgi:hypothetical protein
MKLSRPSAEGVMGVGSPSGVGDLSEIALIRGKRYKRSATFLLFPLLTWLEAQG